MGLSIQGWRLAALAAAGLAASSLVGCDTKSATNVPASANAQGKAESGGASGAARRLNAGLWETVTTVNGHAMPPARTCVSDALAAEINGDDASVRNGLTRSNAAPGCNVDNITIDGSRVGFDTVCDGQTVSTALTYGGDRYFGDMTIAGNRTMTLSAHRVGACPADGAS